MLHVFLRCIRCPGAAWKALRQRGVEQAGNSSHGLAGMSAVWHRYSCDKRKEGVRGAARVAFLLIDPRYVIAVSKYPSEVGGIITVFRKMKLGPGEMMSL